MTLYLSDRTDYSEDGPEEIGRIQIIDNYGDEHSTITGDGELVIDIGEMYHPEKAESLAQIATDAVGETDAYEVEQDPVFSFVPKDERGDVFNDIIEACAHARKDGKQPEEVHLTGDSLQSLLGDSSFIHDDDDGIDVDDESVGRAAGLDVYGSEDEDYVITADNTWYEV